MLWKKAPPSISQSLSKICFGEAKCSHCYLMFIATIFVAKALLPREPVPNGLHWPARKLLVWHLLCLNPHVLPRKLSQRNGQTFFESSPFKVTGPKAPSVAMLLRVLLRMMPSITLSKFRDEGLDANMATSSVLRWVKTRWFSERFPSWNILLYTLILLHNDPANKQASMIPQYST